MNLDRNLPDALPLGYASPNLQHFRRRWHKTALCIYLLGWTTFGAGLGVITMVLLFPRLRDDEAWAFGSISGAAAGCAAALDFQVRQWFHKATLATGLTGLAVATYHATSVVTEQPRSFFWELSVLLSVMALVWTASLVAAGCCGLYITGRRKALHGR